MRCSAKTRGVNTRITGLNGVLVLCSTRRRAYLCPSLIASQGGEPRTHQHKVLGGCNVKTAQRSKSSVKSAKQNRFNFGVYLGRVWCMEQAENEQLEQLDRLRDLSHDQWRSFFELDKTNAFSVSERFYFEIDPGCGRTRQFAKDFWDAILDGCDRSLDNSAEFVRGFAEGALSVGTDFIPQL